MLITLIALEYFTTQFGFAGAAPGAALADFEFARRVIDSFLAN